MVAPVPAVAPQTPAPQLPPAPPEEGAGARMDGAIAAAATGAQAAPKPPIDQILRDYQVPTDPNPKVPVGGKELTSGEADVLLNDLAVWQIPQMIAAESTAGSATYNLSGKPVSEMSGTEVNDGHQDAFRHAYWNTLMTANVGEDHAAKFATAHEAVPGNPAAREAMDLYNNEVGRRIGAENRGASDETLASLVRDAVNKGEMLVIDRSGELAWSNTVAIGQHGQASGPEGAPNLPPTTS